MSIIQTKPTGSSTESVHSDERKLYIVPPSAIQVVDSVLMGDVIVVKWLISLRNIVTNDTNVFEVLAVNDEVAPEHNITNLVGVSIPVDVRVYAQSNYMLLEITNNISDNIEVRVSKLTMER